ncbi:histidine phosphatase family protein [Ilumatobacter coccineus]|uniref:Phosphoglycerate mutase family protein n=1 Tax=Ilumatobacter coccineus (strain NBRC 103263 / KCTC 29153 / YM16-304) TaxID=1313172 RepID=A0A6C7E854_ILUCY|nr:histidine phosphatase family protein [Ilumatobacter coccineus]BAN02212.1 phosphoglycerate mutase family protein [Ilumatobacter coccineus YM16-304]
MLILLRHGRTEANKAGLLQGRLDQDLDDLGRLQAERSAAKILGDADVDAVIASPLKRAQQTAAAFGKPVETDERWIELSYGVYEGVPHADVPSEVWNTWLNDFDFVPDGGESLSTLDARVRGACDDLIERAVDQNIVVVSHVSPMKSAVGWALGTDIGISWNCHLDHASICTIGFRGRRPILQTFNHTA